MASRASCVFGFLWTVASAVSIAETPQEAAELLVREGVQMHRKGGVGAAVEIYRRAIELDPLNSEARYELALGYFDLQKYSECAEAAAQGLRKTKGIRSLLYTVQGNCLDAAGDAKGAIKVYKKAMEISPGDKQLLLNYAITLLREKEVSKAELLLEDAIELDPRYASAHRMLGYVAMQKRDRPAAVLSLLRFLSLEGYGARASEAAKLLQNLYQQGVSQTSENEISLVVGSDMASELGALDLMITMAAGATLTEESKSKTEGERAAQITASVIGFLAEDRGNAKSKSLAVKLYRPFFQEMASAKLGEPFGHWVVAPLSLPGSAEWKVANALEMERLATWLKEH